MGIAEFLQAPLQSKLRVGRVFWLYGVAGSLAYGCLEFFIDPGRTLLLRAYEVGGWLYSAYVIVGTYRCSVNCTSVATARLVRISSVVSLILLPILAYLELSGAFDLGLSQLEL